MKTMSVAQVNAELKKLKRDNILLRRENEVLKRQNKSLKSDIVELNDFIDRQDFQKGSGD